MLLYYCNYRTRRVDCLPTSQPSSVEKVVLSLAHNRLKLKNLEYELPVFDEQLVSSDKVHDMEADRVCGVGWL